MLNNLKEEIRKTLTRESKYVSNSNIKRHFIGLIALKYCYDKNKFNYEDLIKEENYKKITEYTNDTDLKILLSRLIDLNVIKLFIHIQYEDLQKIVKEYLKSDTIGIKIINNNFKKICISNKFDEFIYDTKGNTTYVTDRYNITRFDIAMFKLFDKIFEIENKYETYNNISLDNYEYVYLYNNTPKYRFLKESDNDHYKIIRELLYKNKKLKIYLHTDYKKISNLKDARYIIEYMSKVILFDELNTFVYCETKEEDKISIINYNKDKIKSLDKLFQIIENDRKQKDILVKITGEDIKNNNYRIGFKLYQTGMEESIRNINEIVDENTRLIDRLSRINSEIEQEINKLINR